MESVAGFDCVPLVFTADGMLQDAATLDGLIQHARNVHTTDVVFLAHGFRNDEGDARSLYTRFLESFRAHVQRPELASLAHRRFLVALVFWPSKSFRESFDEGRAQAAADPASEKRDVQHRLERLKRELHGKKRDNIDRALQLLDQVELSEDAQNEFVELVLSIVDTTELDPTEGLDQIRSHEGAELLRVLGAPIVLPTTDSDSDDEGHVLVVSPDPMDDTAVGSTAGIGAVFGSIFGRIGQLLNLTTWYQMKARAGKVGATGVADAVRTLRSSLPDTKIHLVGHSLGGRLVAACAKSLAAADVSLDSLTLLQAAFSHYGLSSTLKNQPGFFRAIIEKNVVKGPLVSTYSSLDTVVGKAYAIASRLAHDNTEAIGDEHDEYGGIGRNGAQNAQHSIVEPLHRAGQRYTFTSGAIMNLNGSEHLIVEHSDVTNANVTYAVASAIAAI